MFDPGESILYSALLISMGPRWKAWRLAVELTNENVFRMAEFRVEYRHSLVCYEASRFLLS